MELDGRRALITGAGAVGGIGYETARQLISAGAEVLISGRDMSRGTEAAETLGEHARFIEADLADRVALDELVAAAGKVDILVNNATAVGRGHTTDQNFAGLDEVLATNIRAPYILTAELARGMVSRRSGCVINISSLVAGRGTPGMGSYAASKAAIESLTKTWAAELGGSGIRVNAVAPGPIKSAKNLNSAMDELEEFARLTPLARAGSTEEVAQMVAFLASDRASYITGAVIAVDGGARAV